MVFAGRHRGIKTALPEKISPCHHRRGTKWAPSENASAKGLMFLWGQVGAEFDSGASIEIDPTAPKYRNFRVRVKKGHLFFETLRQSEIVGVEKRDITTVSESNASVPRRCLALVRLRKDSYTRIFHLQRLQRGQCAIRGAVIDNDRLPIGVCLFK